MKHWKWNVRKWNHVEKQMKNLFLNWIKFQPFWLKYCWYQFEQQCLRRQNQKRDTNHFNIFKIGKTITKEDKKSDVVNFDEQLCLWKSLERHQRSYSVLLMWFEEEIQSSPQQFFKRGKNWSLCWLLCILNDKREKNIVIWSFSF